MKNFLSMLLALILVGAITPGSAVAERGEGDFFIAPSLLYYTNLRSRTSKEERSYLMYEAKAGYTVYENVYVGFAYQAESDEAKTSGFASAALNNTSTGERSSFGPSVAYATSTFHAAFTYYYWSTWKLDTVTSTGANIYEYKGSGFQFDVGYKIPFGPVFFGPQLTYKIFTYEKLSTDGGSSSSISPKLKDTAIEPSIVLFLFF